MFKSINLPAVNLRAAMAGGVLLLLSCLPARAQQATAPFTISLKGDWRFSVDSGDQGVAGKWYADTASGAGG